MNESFIVCKDSFILNRLSDFHATSCLDYNTYFYVHFGLPIVVKKDVMPSIVSVTMPFVIDDVMKIKLVNE